MPKQKSTDKRTKKSAESATGEKVGQMKVVRHPPAERKRLPPDLEAFANSDDRRIARPRPATRLDDPRAVYLVPGVANRHARSVYDAHLPLIQELVSDWKTGDEDARYELGEALAHAARTGLWRGRSITSFDAFVEGVLAVTPKDARAMVEEAEGSFPEQFADRTIAIWMRVEAAFAEVGAAPGSHVEQTDEGDMVIMVVPATHVPSAVAAAAQLLAPFAREDEEARGHDAQSGAAERESHAAWRVDARKVNEGADLEAPVTMGAAVESDAGATADDADDGAPAFDGTASPEPDDGHLAVGPGDEDDDEEADDDHDENGGVDDDDEEEREEPLQVEAAAALVEDGEGDEGDEVADTAAAPTERAVVARASAASKTGDAAPKRAWASRPVGAGQSSRAPGRDERVRPSERDDRGAARGVREPRREGPPPRRFGGDGPTNDRGPRREGPPPRRFGGGAPTSDRGPRRDGPPPRRFGGDAAAGDRGPRRDGPPPRRFDDRGPSPRRDDRPRSGGFGPPKPRGPKKR